MRELITADSIATTVRLLRVSAPEAAFLLVEGDSDARLFSRLVIKPGCIIQNCYNRDKALTVLGRLDASGFQGHLVIIDRDFSDLIGEVLASPNLILTDLNDVESMIFSSKVFEDILAEFSTPEKIAAVENAQGMNVRSYIMRQASFVGGLRFLSRDQAWHLDFDDMTIRFRDRASLALELDRQVEHLRGRTQGTSMPAIGDTIVLLETLLEEAPHGMAYVCGHDLCEFVSRALHTFLGRAHIGLGRGGQAIEEIFRVAYSLEEFSDSTVFAGIREWEAANQPFRVLPA